MSHIDVLSVVSEMYPLIKTGGLADVAGALPHALAPLDVRVRTLVPGYPAVMGRIGEATAVRSLADWFGGPATLLKATADGLDLYVLDAPHLYDRPGGPYGGADGKPYADNAIRFAALARMGAEIAQGFAPRFKPRVVHSHDWQAGLTAAYLVYSGKPRPAVVHTIHNLAFQGQFDRTLLASLGLPAHAFTPDGVEYYGDIGFLKAGVRLADRITTVSPTYAAEICTPDGGMGMDGLLRGRSDRLSGILNGIDTSVWDPARDPHIAAHFSARHLDRREENKAALQRRLKLAVDPDAPLFGVVSRLDWQKGLDLLLETLPTILGVGGQLALLGSGDPGLQDGFRRAMAAHPGRIGSAFLYDEQLAHQIQAGSDLIMVPSRFEPCGLTQLCALRYGAVPLVAGVGGLVDTVIGATPMSLAAGVATGVSFSPVQAPMLERTIRQAAELYADKPVWSKLQANGMAVDVSWAAPARRYASLFEELAKAT